VHQLGEENERMLERAKRRAAQAVATHRVCAWNCQRPAGVEIVLWIDDEARHTATAATAARHLGPLGRGITRVAADDRVPASTHFCAPYG
jgi:hypothetical protein